MKKIISEKNIAISCFITKYCFNCIAEKEFRAKNKNSCKVASELVILKKTNGKGLTFETKEIGNKKIKKITCKNFRK